MSRSLDKDLLAKLKSEDPTAVYKDICRVLSQPAATHGLLEIELLGKSHPLEPGVNFLQDENAVAIPKLRLVQAFFVARQVIQNHLASSPKPPESEIVAATSVALLMDPEHLTAANIRKRAVLLALEKGDEPASILHAEKKFTDSLLTARLHRHTKSPTLWSHRRWLIHRFAIAGLNFDARQDLTRVIFVSAERHPRNYYAWTHARWLVQGASFRQPEAALLTTLADDVKEWCFKHHNDISGWMYLNFILLRIEDDQARAKNCSSVLAETLGIVKSFRWTNESVWVFLRIMVARDFVENELFESFKDLNKSLSSDIGQDSPGTRPLEAALQWSCQHRRTRSNSNEDFHS
jgi:protein prenyltransferase alpha subunit repeat containing protein 1